MKVITIPKGQTIEVVEEEKPQAQQGNAIIKMVACGICGSDVTAYRGTNPTVKYPIDGVGHEGVGIIEEIGENSKGLKVGDRVVLEPYVPCNECHMCKKGRFNNCANLRVCGVHKNGMMAEYFEHPIELLYAIPDDLDDHTSCMIEPLTISLHALSRSQIEAGEICVIFGAGTIGLLAALACKCKGATPILVDVVDVRLNRAKEFGVEYTFNSMEGDVEQYLSEVTNGKMADVMLECTGAKVVIENLHNYVNHGGRVSLVGWPHEPVQINTIRCMQKELNLYPCRNSNRKFEESMALIHEGKIPAEKMITKVIEAEQFEETVCDMIQSPDKYIKVVVKL